MYRGYSSVVAMLVYSLVIKERRQGLTAARATGAVMINQVIIVVTTRVVTVSGAEG